MFDPFRVLQSLDRSEGSGVGLALVNRDHGEIAIADRGEPVGVRFVVTWPARIIQGHPATHGEIELGV